MTRTPSRLILIEGMIGAGKTTTAVHLAKWLADQGEAADAYHEFADDHPIRSEVVDRLRADWLGHREGGAFEAPSLLPEGTAGRQATRASPRSGASDAAAVRQWGELAARCRDARRTTILESAFLQNSVMPSFIDEASGETVRTVFSQIETRIAPANPLLVYLRPSDTARAVERVHAERGEPWSSWNLASVSRCAWARRRGLSGRDAVVALYRSWERVVDELLATCSFATLLLVDPQDDWDEALQRIYSAVRARRASARERPA